MKFIAMQNYEGLLLAITEEGHVYQLGKGYGWSWTLLCASPFPNAEEPHQMIERCHAHKSFNGCEMIDGNSGPHRSGELTW